jgi:hypothetical protein
LPVFPIEAGNIGDCGSFSKPVIAFDPRVGVPEKEFNEYLSSLRKLFDVADRYARIRKKSGYKGPDQIGVKISFKDVGVTALS